MENQPHFVAPGLGLNGKAVAGPRNEQPCNTDLLSTIVGESKSVIPPVTLAGYSNFHGLEAFLPQACDKNFLRHCRKHKREDEDHCCDHYPPKKKRLTNEACVAQNSTADTGVPYIGKEVLNLRSSCGEGNRLATSTLEMPCEEMEHTVWKQQSERTLTLQEIEDRLTDDEELETENCVGNLPKIVFSDTLKEELKRDLNGALTNKILKSRPHCMELVVWKPLSVFDANKQTSSKECEDAFKFYLTKTAAMGTTFLEQQENLNKREHITVSPKTTFSNLPDPWCSDEEEMEL